MQRTFQIISKHGGYVMETVTVDVEVGTTLDEAAAEARAEYEAMQRDGAKNTHEAQSVIDSIARVEWVMPTSTVHLAPHAAGQR